MLIAAVALSGSLNVTSFLSAQEPSPAQDIRAADEKTEMELIGPDGFSRVDGLDHDLDEMLGIFQPGSTQELAVFSDPQAWKTFYDEIYGDSPSDLSFFATISAADGNEAAHSPDLDFNEIKRHFSTLRQVGPEALAGKPAGSAMLGLGRPSSTPFELIEQQDSFISFKAHMGLTKEELDQAESLKGRYFTVVSTVKINDQLVFLSLYSNHRGPKPDEVEKLAFAWREAFLAKTVAAQASEPQSFK